MREFIQVLLFALVMSLFFVAIFGLMFGMGYIIDKPKHIACEELGFEKYMRSGIGERFSYCEDEQYNLHYVKFTNCGIINCEANLIIIGDVTTKHDVQTREGVA